MLSIEIKIVELPKFVTTCFIKSGLFKAEVLIKILSAPELISS